MVKEVNSQELSQILSNDKGRVVVDFYSTECPPCEALAPLLIELESLYSNDFSVYKINRQDNRELALELNVRSSPTLLFFDKSHEVGTRLSGTITVQQLIGAVVDAFQVEARTLIVPDAHENIWDVLILGAGPAGLAAAVYTARAGKKTLVLKGKAKSHLELAHLVENYPGLPPLSGKELLQNMETQAQGFGATIESGDALDLTYGHDVKLVTTRTNVYKAKTIILAMGKGQHQQTIENEERLIGLGVSYCATCDGAFYRGKKVVVYGNDEEAMDDALMLKQLDCDVAFVSYCKSAQCSESLHESAKKKGVVYYPDAQIKSLSGQATLESVTIETEAGSKTLEAEAVFIIQSVPSKSLLRKTGINVESKDCIAIDKELRTNLSGIFAAGDITCGGLQVAVAVGEGVSSALSALKYLRQNS